MSYTATPWVITLIILKCVIMYIWGAGWGGGGSRIRYSITNFVLIRDSISEISP